MGYEKFLNCIPKGRENAVGAGNLTTLWGCKDDREARRIRESLRLSGYLILADGHGIYQPNDDEELAAIEIRDYVQMMERRIKTERLSIKPCKNYLKVKNEFVGQLSLF